MKKVEVYKESRVLPYVLFAAVLATGVLLGLAVAALTCP